MNKKVNKMEKAKKKGTLQTLQANVEIPDNCEFKRENQSITVKGPKGEITRILSDKQVKIAKNDKELILTYDKITQREKKNLFTTAAHMRNMIRGVQEGFTYKLKICSGHFPMSVALKGNVFEIKNFIGEKVPRTLKIKPGVDVKIDGDIVTVYAIDKEMAGLTAGAIEKLTRRPGFDKRIFQDGIYITEKDGKKIGN
jgi:large subunit ribosomal protein L6